MVVTVMVNEVGPRGELGALAAVGSIPFIIWSGFALWCMVRARPFNYRALAISLGIVTLVADVSLFLDMGGLSSASLLGMLVMSPLALILGVYTFFVFRRISRKHEGSN